MTRRRAEHATADDARLYTCVLAGDHWHLTQEQAAPPPVHLGGAWTVCGVWAEFKRGYDKRRPTCATCVRAVTEFEASP